MIKYFIPIIGLILLIRDVYSTKKPIENTLYLYNQDSYILLILYTMFFQVGLVTLILRYLTH